MESVCRKRRSSKRNVIGLSESEEETEQDDIAQRADDETRTKRRSTRISDKQGKPKFRLPSRDEIWNDIPSLKSQEKLKTISPRKSVNNFTKVYNDYNFDDYDEDTSEEENSSDDTSDSEDDEKMPWSNQLKAFAIKEPNIETKHRIKNYRKRIKPQVSSSDEDEGKTVAPGKLGASADHVLSNKQDDKDSSVMENNMSSKKCDSLDENTEELPVDNATFEDSDDSEVCSPLRRHQKNHSIIESDSEGDDNNNNNDEGDSQNDSRNGSDDNTNTSDSEESVSDQITSRSAKFKLKQKRLFQEFNEAQSKRSKKVPKTGT